MAALRWPEALDFVAVLVGSAACLTLTPDAEPDTEPPAIASRTGLCSHLNIEFSDNTTGPTMHDDTNTASRPFERHSSHVSRQSKSERHAEQPSQPVARGVTTPEAGPLADRHRCTYACGSAVEAQ